MEKRRTQTNEPKNKEIDTIHKDLQPRDDTDRLYVNPYTLASWQYCFLHDIILMHKRHDIIILKKKKEQNKTMTNMYNLILFMFYSFQHLMNKFLFKMYLIAKMNFNLRYRLS